MTSIFETPSRDLRVGLAAAGREDDLMARDRVDRLAGDRGRTCPRTRSRSTPRTVPDRRVGVGIVNSSTTPTLPAECTYSGVLNAAAGARIQRIAVRQGTPAVQRPHPLG